MDEIILTPDARKPRATIETLKNTEEGRIDYLPENTKLYLNTVITDITPYLKQEQLVQLVQVLCKVFNNVECVKSKHRSASPKQYNDFLLKEFIKTRTAEACSKKTLQYYKSTISRFSKNVNKHFDEVQTEDVEDYFVENMNRERNPWSPTTQDNVRRILNTFYEWAVGRKYILYNPIKPIKPTKHKRYRVKKPFTTEDMIKLRDNCSYLRDRVMIELLVSSGIRVSELVQLDRDDMNWTEREFTIIGKGNKQRIAYFNNQAHYYMQKYLQSRTDNNPAMFVTLNAPYARLGVTGVETTIRVLGEKAGVSGRAHPHRFRHTFATQALNKGVPIEQVQQLLGHEQLDTTLIYAKVAREDVKYAHKRLMN